MSPTQPGTRSNVARSARVERGFKVMVAPALEQETCPQRTPSSRPFHRSSRSREEWTPQVVESPVGTLRYAGAPHASFRCRRHAPSSPSGRDKRAPRLPHPRRRRPGRRRDGDNRRLRSQPCARGDLAGLSAPPDRSDGLAQARGARRDNAWPAGEEIHTDEFGRVRVQFHWDREGTRDERSSCWLPVSQAWGGAGFGGVNLPRVGQEVLVDFLNGDPDRPVVIGRVFTRNQPTPYPLPAHRTVSGLRSESSPRGRSVGAASAGSWPAIIAPRRRTGNGRGRDRRGRLHSLALPRHLAGRDHSPLVGLRDHLPRQRRKRARLPASAARLSRGDEERRRRGRGKQRRHAGGGRPTGSDRQLRAARDRAEPDDSHRGRAEDDGAERHRRRVGGGQRTTRRGRALLRQREGDRTHRRRADRPPRGVEPHRDKARLHRDPGAPRVREPGRRRGRADDRSRHHARDAAAARGARGERSRRAGAAGAGRCPALRPGGTPAVSRRRSARGYQPLAAARERVAPAPGGRARALRRHAEKPRIQRYGAARSDRPMASRQPQEARAMRVA
ncbi:MAG: type VI secretion system tip protein VgrG [Myxococcales bacterium]|nr:type VI secretion system tip protein VgrG [Myxococcales bacterium]